MIVSYEVGAVYRLVDEATPALRALTERFEVLDRIVTKVKAGLAELSEARFAGLSRSMATLDRSMAKVGTSAERMGTLVGTSMEAATVRLVAATEQAQAFATAMSEAAGAARAVRVAGGGPVVGGGGGGRGTPHGPRQPGFHLSGVSTRFPGGHANFRGGSNVGLAAAGMLAYGVYEEAEIEDIVARALMTGQVAIGPNMTQMEAFKSLRDIIQRGASQGGFDPKEVGHSILTTERQFGGLTFEKRMEVLKTLLPAAMTEARMKDAKLPEAFEALVGLAHMTGTFEADKLPAVVKGFTYASTITPVPIKQFERALSYSMPMLHAGLNMDPNAIMFLTAMTQTAGVTNSKSGTWLRSFFERLMPQEGALHVRSKGARAHNESLRDMGLLDAGNKPTWQIKGPGGEVDWMASVIDLAQRLQGALAKMPDNARLGRLQRAFGERGGGFGALMNLPQFVDQLPLIASKMKSFQGGDDFLSELQRVSPAQQARAAMTDLKNVLMNLGSVVLPPLTSILQSVDASLKVIVANMPAAGTKSQAAFSGMMKGSIAGAGIGFAIGRFGGPIGMGGGAALGGIIGAGYGLYEHTQEAVNEYAKAKGYPLTSGGSLPGLTPGHRRDSMYEFRRQQRESLSKLADTVNITVQSAVDDPKAHAEAIAAELARQLAIAQTHNLGEGAGSHASPFTSGQ